MQTGVLIAAATTIVLGGAIMLLGVVRMVTRRQLATFRRSVALTVTGSGISAFGVALLMLAIGTLNAIALTAAGIVSVVSLGQLLFAAAIRRSS